MNTNRSLIKVQIHGRRSAKVKRWERIIAKHLGPRLLEEVVKKSADRILNGNFYDNTNSNL
jgi:hypothetical protein